MDDDSAENRATSVAQLKKMAASEEGLNVIGEFRSLSSFDPFRIYPQLCWLEGHIISSLATGKYGSEDMHVLAQVHKMLETVRSPMAGHAAEFSRYMVELSKIETAIVDMCRIAIAEGRYDMPPNEVYDNLLGQGLEIHHQTMYWLGKMDYDFDPDEERDRYFEGRVSLAMFYIRRENEK